MKLDHIVILLSELETCIAFYKALLPKIGFSPEKDHVFSNADGIYLDFRQASEPQHGYHRHAPGLNHLAFTAPDRESIVKICADMADDGFEVPDIQEFEDGSALFLKDSDGMRVEISSYVQNS